jgi:ATP-dependent helicase Lhr and Lhr-like helicase
LKNPSALAHKWYQLKQWAPHSFQKECWQAVMEQKSGLLNAPTGSGKTMALWFGILELYYRQNKEAKGLHCLYISPLRALSKEISLATQQVSDSLGLGFSIGLRSGDTSTAERNAQKKSLPNALITTPESVHILLSQKGAEATFGKLQVVIVDEWHELMGSKRGVQVELALSRLKAINPNLIVWGISATIGNLPQAMEVLHGNNHKNCVLIQAKIPKKYVLKTIFPETLDHFPWAGHLGIQLLPQVLKLIMQSNTTLVFTNTRSFAEIWYQQLLSVAPQLAGQIAMHHGSLSPEVRKWVEDALHTGTLKAVICTSSLDLGVDFQPVDTVIQIGSPKGVSRLIQRAGRSGHRPGATSSIYFVPTHSLEIIEGSALRIAMEANELEAREPYVRSFDVLIQYLMTLAVADGFQASTIYKEITQTHCFETITPQEWAWCLHFLSQGGQSLQAYDEYQKITQINGLYKVENRRIALRHKLSIGTIMSDSMIKVQLMNGKYLGTLEEYFVSRLNPGDCFYFSGMNLEFVQIKEMQAIVKKSNKKKGQVPSYQGGRMALSSELSGHIREQIQKYFTEEAKDQELAFLQPLLQTQAERSHLPKSNELLIEKLETKDGHHVFVYPFEGRAVHEGMAAIIAYRIGQILPISFSIAMNDYGFELLSDQPIPIEKALDAEVLSSRQLSDHVMHSVNGVEMARRRFREIASIAGLVFQGYPGKALKTRHLQANSQLFFNVFENYEPDNLLLGQAYDEALNFQLEIGRLTKAFQRIQTQTIVLKTIPKPSPFCFPILVDSLNRDKFSNEALQDRIKRLILGEG